MAGKRAEYSIAFAVGAKLQSSFGPVFRNAERQIAALQKATKNAGSAFSDFGKKVGGLRKDLKILSGIAAGAAGGLFGIAHTAAQSAVTLGQTAERLKMPVETLQGWQYMAEQAGIKTDQFNSYLQKLNSTVAGAVISEKDPFEKWGVSARRLGQSGLDNRRLEAGDGCRCRAECGFRDWYADSCRIQGG